MMLRGLKLYTVHTRPGSDHTLEKPVFLREGFNWFAFLFTFLWAAYHRLWRFALAVFLANVAVMLCVRYGVLNQISGSIVQMGLQFIVGFTANDAMRACFQREGYIFQDITSGESMLAAELRYFDRIVAHAA